MASAQEPAPFVDGNLKVAIREIVFAPSCSIEAASFASRELEELPIRVRIIGAISLVH